MGKLSKRQRTVNRKLREELAQAKAHIGSVAAFKDREIGAWKERAEFAEAKLRRWHDDVARFCSSSTLLPVKDKLKYMNPHMRVMPPPDRSDLMRAWESDLGESLRSVPTEELMMILQSEPALREDMTRRMHFRITNVPGQRGDFAFAYGVTHTAMKSCRYPREFVAMIAEKLAVGIWGEIYGEEKK